jgi:predicted Rossmann fold nucleotide-binding protein DprA/Smf involved in DNA uptake
MSERVAIIGSREISPERQRIVEEIIKGLPNGTIIITGDEMYGVDSYAMKVGTDMGFVVMRSYAPWMKIGKSAGAYRNNAIASMCTCMFVIWDGKNAEIRSTIEIARKMGKHVESFVAS